ncbi:hypothetical protein BH24PSE2_BH24PSE2_02660 [soil metagenome]
MFLLQAALVVDAALGSRLRAQTLGLNRAPAVDTDPPRACAHSPERSSDGRIFFGRALRIRQRVFTEIVADCFLDLVVHLSPQVAPFLRLLLRILDFALQLVATALELPLQLPAFVLRNGLRHRSYSLEGQIVDEMEQALHGPCQSLNAATLCRGPMSRRRRLFIVLVIAVVLAVVVRSLLPLAVERFANRELQDLGAYTGRIEDVDLAIWRGAYSIENIRIDKKTGGIPEPFFSAPRVDISIDWAALFRGALVAEAHAASPRVVFVDAETKERSQKGPEPVWAEKLQSLAPFRFDRITVNDGRLEFRNFEADPEVELYVDTIRIVATNLTNIRNGGGDAFANVEARGSALGVTPVRVDGRLDPIADPPELELNAELEKLPLTEMNSFLDAYLNVDAEAGTFSLYTEIATADGRFKGYVKPLLEDANIMTLSEEGGFFRKAWEGLVDLVAEVFENQSAGQFGTEIPLSGELDAVDIELLPAIFNVLRNAFVQALSASITGTVNLEDVDDPHENERQSEE